MYHFHPSRVLHYYGPRTAVVELENTRTHLTLSKSSGSFQVGVSCRRCGMSLGLSRLRFCCKFFPPKAGREHECTSAREPSSSRPNRLIYLAIPFHNNSGTSSNLTVRVYCSLYKLLLIISCEYCIPWSLILPKDHAL